METWRSYCKAYAKAYRDFDGIIWDTAIATLFRFQKAVGNKLHIMHMSTPEALDMLRRAKDARPASCEVNPWALFLATWENVEKLGPYCLGFWVPPAHVEALWKGINMAAPASTLSARITRRTQREKDIGWKDMWKSPGGEPQIQDYLSLFSLACYEGKLTLDTLVRITSYNPARIFGVYPRKGVIQPGADADMVIVDMNKEEVISNETTYTKVGWTPPQPES